MHRNTDCFPEAAFYYDSILVHETVFELMKNGWRMKNIDEMDMRDFLRLQAWDATRKQENKKPRQRFIDEV